MGCVAKATSEELHVDKTEMDEVRWIHRDRVLQVVQASSSSDNPLLGAAYHCKLANAMCPRWSQSANNSFPSDKEEY